MSIFCVEEFRVIGLYNSDTLSLARMRSLEQTCLQDPVLLQWDY